MLKQINGLIFQKIKPHLPFNFLQKDLNYTIKTLTTPSRLIAAFCYTK